MKFTKKKIQSPIKLFLLKKIKVKTKGQKGYIIVMRKHMGFQKF